MAVTEELGLRIVTQGLNKFMSDMKGAESAVSGAASGMSKAGVVAGKAGAAFQAVGKAAFGAVVAGSALVVGAVGGVATAIIDLTLKAAPLEGIGASFGVMADKFGVSLDVMRAASGGAVSDFELMRMANVALTGAGEDFGAEFGKKLPNLLEAARVAARATGQDVGFLFDSLVTGIKRGSPLLIDNTGLVLKVGEANEAMAKSLGKTVEELTAEEKQIALLNATVAAGDAMIAQYGSAQDSAAMQIASFKTSIQNAKDEIGIAFLPVLQMVMEPLMELSNAVIPVVVEAVQNFAEHFGTLIAMLQEGIAPLDAIGFFLVRMGVSPEAVQSIKDFATGIQEFVDQAIIAIEPIVKWISENVKLQDVLIVLGAAIASVIIPAIAGFIAAVAPVVAVVIGAIAIVAALRAAWESDFMGIQTTTMSIIESIKTFISNALTAIRQFWADNGDAIMTKAAEIWETVRSTTATVFDGIKTVINDAVAGIGVIFDAFKLTSEGKWTEFGAALRAIWDDIWAAIKTAVDTAIPVIMDTIAGLVDSIMTAFTSTDWGAVGTSIITGIGNAISAGAGAIAAAARNAAKAALDAAIGLLGGGGGGTTGGGGGGAYQHGGTTSGRSMLVGERGPELLTGVPGGARVASAPTTARMISQSSATTNNYNLTTNSITRPGGLALEFASMEMGSR